MKNLESRQNFFPMADEMANEKYANFDTALDGTAYNADGDETANVSVADPFIIKLTNASTDSKSDVTFLNAGKQFANASGNYGLDSSITPSYEVSGLDYGQLLADLLTNTYRIGQIYTESSTSANLNATLKIETYNITGKGGYHTLSPKQDVYQTLTTGLMFRTNFILNSFTKITMSSLAASSNVTFNLYPSQAGLKTVTTELIEPQIVRPAVR